MHLNKRAFNLIKSGNKTIEVRLNDKKRRKIELNDEIIFISPEEDSTEQIITKVVGLSKFVLFRNLFKELNAKNMGWDYEPTVQEEIENIRKYYSEEDERTWGALGIHLEILKE